MSRQFLSINGEPFTRLTRDDAAETLRQARAAGRVVRVEGASASAYSYHIEIEGAGRCLGTLFINRRDG